MVEHFLLRCSLWPQLNRDSWALALWSFSERGGVSPLALREDGERADAQEPGGSRHPAPKFIGTRMQA